MTGKAKFFSDRFDDFGDWLNPMVVKELRQKLRRRAFVISYMLFQLSMFVIILSQVNSRGNMARSGMPLVFLFLAAAFFIISMQSFNFIRREQDGNTLQMLILTQMSPFKIVAGIWLSVVLMLSLVIVSIVPFLVISYFIGGVDIIENLKIAIAIFLMFSLLSAFSMMISGNRIVITIMGFIGGFFLTYLAIIAMWAFWGFSRGRGSGDFFINIVLQWYFWPIYIAYLLFFLLLSASKIQPSGKNYLILGKILSLALTLACFISVFFIRSEDGRNAILVIASIPAGFIVFYAITENPEFLVESYKILREKFSSRLLKPIALILAPGWHCGILFTIVSYSILYIGFVYSLNGGDFDFSSTANFLRSYGNNYAIILYFILLPLLVVIWLSKFNPEIQQKNRIRPAYIVVHVIMKLVIFLSMITFPTGFLLMFIFVVPEALFTLNNSNKDFLDLSFLPEGAHDYIIGIVSFALLAVTFLFLIIFVKKHYAKTLEMLKT